MIRTAAAAAALAASLAVAPSAHSTVVTGTYSGVVNAGFDYAGTFGPPSTDLTGDSVSGTFRYDTTYLPALFVGFYFAIAPAVPLTISETINGHTVTVAGNYVSQLTLSNFPPTSTFAPHAVAADFSTTANIMAQFDNSLYSVDPAAPGGVRFSLAGLDLGTGFFTVYTGCTGFFGCTQTSFSDFTLTAIAASPVPEPASAAVVTAGLLAAGLVRRRRA